jgi:polysaccharide deacetylase family protein (PEP-CTERM system associated)
MSSVAIPLGRLASEWDRVTECCKEPLRIILSVDVEEHFRIEAAAGLHVSPALRDHLSERVEPSTRWLLEHLDRQQIRATFFLLGVTARNNPALVRDIARAGHEVASHGWDHQRVHNFNPRTFRADLHQSRDILEQLTGEAVVGYRAPTFSIVRQTCWALDVLAEAGMLYDSSIYPVRHDRYGVSQAPRAPFRVRGGQHTLLEIPPATLQLLGANLPVGGGGYFRLLPLFLMERAFEQVEGTCHPPVAMLYFHPWEFDPRQLRLPLGRLRRFRTYVGIYRSQARLASLLARRPRHLFARAVDVARELDIASLPRFDFNS